MKKMAMLAILAGLAWSMPAEANGRKYAGGHPYHNGYYAWPPMTAWAPVTVRPPMFYGWPAYYIQSSYMDAGSMGAQPTTAYDSIPSGRAGSYYMMSAHGQMSSYPWK